MTEGISNRRFGIYNSRDAVAFGSGVSGLIVGAGAATFGVSGAVVAPVGGVVSGSNFLGALNRKLIPFFRSMPRFRSLAFVGGVVGGGVAALLEAQRSRDELFQRKISGLQWLERVGLSGAVGALGGIGGAFGSMAGANAFSLLVLSSAGMIEGALICGLGSLGGGVFMGLCTSLIVNRARELLFV